MHLLLKYGAGNHILKKVEGTTKPEPRGALVPASILGGSNESPQTGLERRIRLECMHFTEFRKFRPRRLDATAAFICTEAPVSAA